MPSILSYNKGCIPVDPLVSWKWSNSMNEIFIWLILTGIRSLFNSLFTRSGTSFTHCYWYIYIYVHIYIHYIYVYTYSILCPPCDFSVLFALKLEKGDKGSEPSIIQTELPIQIWEWKRQAGKSQKERIHTSPSLNVNNVNVSICAAPQCVQHHLKATADFYDLSGFWGVVEQGTACLFCTMSRASPGLTPWLKAGPLGLPSTLLDANSGSLRVPPPRLTLAWEFHSSQTSCMMAHGSGSSFPKARAESARLLRTWPHESQNIILLVMKMLRPALTERKGALSLPLKGKSSRGCVTMFSSSKGRADLQEQC